MVRIGIPAVPDGADVHRSWRRVLAGLDELAVGDATVLGREVGKGAVVATAPGALVLVVDQHITSWGEAYYSGKRYPLMDGAFASPGSGRWCAKALWARHFKRALGAFGAAGLGQLCKHLAMRPPPEDLQVLEVVPGPGRPNFKPGPCRWRSQQLPEGRVVLCRPGPRRPGRAPRRVPRAAGGARDVLRAVCGSGRAPHRAPGRRPRGPWPPGGPAHGRCEEYPSYEEYERRRAEQQAEDQARRAAVKAEEEKNARKRAAAE